MKQTAIWAPCSSRRYVWTLVLMKIRWLLTESYIYVPSEGENDGCGALPNGPHEQVDIGEKS